MLPEEFTPGVTAFANGKLVAAGTLPDGYLAIAELLANGRLDRRFGDGGVELTPIRLLPWQILALPEGKLLILGPNRYPGPKNRVSRASPTGSSCGCCPTARPTRASVMVACWTSPAYPSATRAATTKSCPSWRPAATSSCRASSAPPFSPSTVSGLVRLNPDGSRDTSFGSDGVLTLAGGRSGLSRCVPTGRWCCR